MSDLLRVILLFVLDIYNLFKLQTTCYSDLQCLGKKHLHPILFLFVIKIIITPCLVNNNVKKKAAKTSIITIHGDEYQFED